MKRSITIIEFIFIIFVISGCAAFKQINETRKVIETCEFKLRSIKPSIAIKGPKISLSGIKGASVKIVFNQDIDVANTTDMGLSMNKFDLKLFVDNKLVVTGTTSKNISIPVGETASLTAIVSVDPEKATKKLAKKLKGKNVAYRVDGTFYFKIKNWNVPIQVTLKEG